MRVGGCYLTWIIIISFPPPLCNDDQLRGPHRCHRVSPLLSSLNSSPFMNESKLHCNLCLNKYRKEKEKEKTSLDRFIIPCRASGPLLHARTRVFHCSKVWRKQIIKRGQSTLSFFFRFMCTYLSCQYYLFFFLFLHTVFTFGGRDHSLKERERPDRPTNLNKSR